MIRRSRHVALLLLLSGVSGALAEPPCLALLGRYLGTGWGSGYHVPCVSNAVPHPVEWSAVASDEQQETLASVPTPVAAVPPLPASPGWIHSPVTAGRLPAGSLPPPRAEWTSLPAAITRPQLVRLPPLPAPEKLPRLPEVDAPNRLPRLPGLFR